MKCLYILIISLSILPIHAMEKEVLEEKKEEGERKELFEVELQLQMKILSQIIRSRIIRSRKMENANKIQRHNQQLQSFKESKLSADQQLLFVAIGATGLYLLANAIINKPADEEGEETAPTSRTLIYSLYE